MTSNGSPEQPKMNNRPARLKFSRLRGTIDAQKALL